MKLRIKPEDVEVYEFKEIVQIMENYKQDHGTIRDWTTEIGALNNILTMMKVWTDKAKTKG
jgi:hypothetical protein